MSGLVARLERAADAFRDAADDPDVDEIVDLLDKLATALDADEDKLDDPTVAAAIATMLDDMARHGL